MEHLGNDVRFSEFSSGGSRFSSKASTLALLFGAWETTWDLPLCCVKTSDVFVHLGVSEVMGLPLNHAFS
jgi:hypothetical protein